MSYRLTIVFAFLSLSILGYEAVAQIPTDSLVVWLKADQGVYSDPFCQLAVTDDNEPAVCWASHTNNDIEVRALGTSLSQYRAGIKDTLNGMPFVSFDGSGGLGSDALASLDFTSLTTFVVVSSAHTGTSLSISESGFLNEEVVHIKDFVYHVNETGSPRCFERKGEKYTSMGHQTSQEILPFVIQTGLFGNADDELNLRLFGSPSTESRSTAVKYCGVPSNPYGPTPYTGIARTMQVGQRATGINTLNGQLAEVIAYRGAHLDEVRLTLVENYLSSRYGIQIFNDRYNGDREEAGDFDFEVAGIGAEADSSVTEGISSGLIIAEANASLGAGEYVLAGHRTREGGTTESNLPDDVAERLLRVWHVDKTGNVDVILGLDFAESTIPPAGDQYIILFKANQEDEYSIPDISPEIQSNKVQFTVTDQNLQDGYYTFATRDAVSSPLPQLPPAFVPTGVAVEGFEIPQGHAVSSIYPNPFNSRGTFSLTLDRPQRVRIAVYDVLGREVAILHNGILTSSAHHFSIQGDVLSDGVYLLSIVGEDFTAMKQAVLLK
ncbi:MAG: T9SS type A sorting domain-containing protein [Rhodothermales bacterium]